MELVVERRDGSRHSILFDEQDAELVASWNWCVVRNGDWGYYAVASGRGRNQRMHVLIMGQRGVDHINHNGLDNRRSNLRLATPAQNGANRRATQGATSAYKGVGWHKRSESWQARIKVDGHLRYLGSFSDEHHAALAYNEAALAAWGDRAFLNEVRM